MQTDDELVSAVREIVWQVKADALMVEEGARAIIPLVLEHAAKIADPPLMHRKGSPGLWRRRRAAIAATIRQVQP